MRDRPLNWFPLLVGALLVALVLVALSARFSILTLQERPHLSESEVLALCVPAGDRAHSADGTLTVSGAGRATPLVRYYSASGAADATGSSQRMPLDLSISVHQDHPGSAIWSLDRKWVYDVSAGGGWVKGEALMLDLSPPPVGGGAE